MKTWKVGKIYPFKLRLSQFSVLVFNPVFFVDVYLLVTMHIKKPVL